MTEVELDFYQAALAGGLIVPLGMLVFIRWLRLLVGRIRSFMGRTEGDPAGMVNVSGEARRLRVRGILLFLAIVATTYYFVTLALANFFTAARQGAPLWAGPVLLGLFLMPGIPLPVLRYRRRRRLGMAPARFSGRHIGAALLGIATIIVVYWATSTIYSGLVLAVVDPDLEAAAAAGLNPDPLRNPDFANTYGALQITVGLVVLAATPLLVRASRAVARAGAAERRKADTRSPVLMLRGFRDDRRRVQAISSLRRPLIEFLWPSTRDRYETVLAWEAEEVGPPIALGRPGSRLRPLGAARERAPETGDDWLNLVREWIDESRVIIWSLDTTDGVIQELGELRGRGALQRTIVVLPPLSGRKLRTRWDQAMAASQGLLPPCPADPAKTLCVYERSGRLVAAAARRRDEASYRAALAAAFQDLGVAERGGV